MSAMSEIHAKVTLCYEQANKLPVGKARDAWLELAWFWEGQAK